MKARFGSLIATACGVLALWMQAQNPPAKQGDIEHRIVRADPSKYRHLKAVHEGAGEMDFRAMLGTDAVEPSLIFFHRGVIPPHSGIGQHFHNKCEEMFVIPGWGGSVHH